MWQASRSISSLDGHPAGIDGSGDRQAQTVGLPAALRSDVERAAGRDHFPGAARRAQLAALATERPAPLLANFGPPERRQPIQ